MINCKNCNLPNEDESLYCEHCGERLDTVACRKCGSYLPPKVKYCTKCGYPASGNVCNKCGKVNPDDSAFCSSCGNKLGAVAQNAYAAVADKAPRVKIKSETGAYAYRVARSFAVAAILMCMFVFSFFGAFKMDVEGTDVSVTGFDAVRGMFLLISPQTMAQNQADLAAFYASSGNLLDPVKALSDFGVLRLMICEESMYASLIMPVILWGIQSLALMVLSLTFFIITLVRAVNVAMKKTDELCRYDTLALSLITALTFGFAVTGGALAAGAITNIVLGAAGLGGILACKFFVEKMPRPSVLANVRRGVCAVLAVVVMCFAGSSLVSIGYEIKDDSGLAVNTGVNVSMDYYDVMDGMMGGPEFLQSVFGDTSYSAEDINKTFLQNITYYMMGSGDISSVQSSLLIYGSPITLCFSQEALRAYGAGATAIGWLTYFFTVFTAASAVMYLFKLFREESEPEKKHQSLPWGVLTAVGSATMLVSGVAALLFGSSISSQLGLGFTYSIGALPIVTVALGAAMAVCDGVMRKLDKKKSDNAYPFADIQA